MEEKGERKKAGPSLTLGESTFSLAEIYLLLAFAIVADLINWIPIVNVLVTIVAFPSYWLYFIIKGVSFAPTLPALIGNLLEIFPVLSAFPMVTVGVAVTIIINIILERAAATKLGRTVTKTAGTASKFIK